MAGTTILGTNKYAALFQSNLDKLIIAEATSTFLEANPNQIQYNGGKTIKIADILVSGLKDYDRSKGFDDAQGTVTLEWTDYSLEQDRAVSFSIDRIDIDETGNMATAATVVAEFGRTQMVPEIDAYRWATISANANVKAPTAAALADGDAFVAAVDKAIVYFQELGMNLSDIALVSTPTNIDLATNSKKWNTMKNTTTIAKGGVDYTVDSYRDIPLIPVPTDRFRDTFTKAAAGGYDKTAGKALNFILMAKTGAATAIVKTDTVRIFEPAVNQKADAYKIDVRVYHDIIIAKNGGKAIYVHKSA